VPSCVEVDVGRCSSLMTLLSSSLVALPYFHSFLARQKSIVALWTYMAVHQNPHTLFVRSRLLRAEPLSEAYYLPFLSICEWSPSVSQEI
jgi:hypothetical protein